MIPGLRLPPISIRARLTAWYTLLLALLLVVLGVFVLRLVEERLYAESGQRLKQTGEDVRKEITKMRPGPLAQLNTDGHWSLFGFLPDLDRRGAWGPIFIQVVNVDDKVVSASPYTPTGAAMLPMKEPWAQSRREFGIAVVNGMETRVMRDPLVAEVRGKEHTIGAIIVGEPLKGVYESLGAVRQTLVFTSGAGLILAVIGGWLLADRALRPVDRVTAAAARIAQGDGTAASLSTRLAVPETGDELARLSATFNEMLDRLEASFHAQQRFVADASHELRTPLTAVRGNVEVLARQVAAAGGRYGNGDVTAALDDIQRESARMGRLLDDLLLLARSDSSKGDEPLNGVEPHPVALQQVARDAMRIAAGLANGQDLTMVAPEPVTVHGDPDRLVQLLLILLDNALRHTPAGKRVTIEVVPPAARMTKLVVRDEGEGIAPEHLPYVFDRFYRADGARGRATGGTGLGLAIARVIARNHGGEISVISEPGLGSEFTVTLPVSEETATRTG